MPPRCSRWASAKVVGHGVSDAAGLIPKEVTMKMFVIVVAMLVTALSPVPGLGQEQPMKAPTKSLKIKFSQDATPENSVVVELIGVPAGEFVMGSPEDDPLPPASGNSSTCKRAGSL